MKDILIIEDDPEIVKLLEIHLTDLIYKVATAADGELGLKMALENDYDLILLDLTLPGMDGIEICKRLRAQKSTPVIMLTAKSEEIDRVLGLEIGADDYITKPFSIRELLARIKAVIRRTDSNSALRRKILPRFPLKECVSMSTKEKYCWATNESSFHQKNLSCWYLWHPTREETTRGPNSSISFGVIISKDTSIR